MRATVWLTGAGLVALGGVGVVVALFMPWSWSGLAEDPPSGPMWAVIIALGPVTSAAVALLSARRSAVDASADPPAARGAAGVPTAGHRDRRPLIAAGAALLGGGIATGVLLDIPLDHGVQGGGPVAVLSSAAAFVGWLLQAAAAGTPRNRARRNRTPQHQTPQDQASADQESADQALAGRTSADRGAVPVVVAASIVLVLGLGAVPAIGWYTEGRFVRHTTGTALPAVPAAPPSELGRLRWQAAAKGFRLLVEPVAAGRHLVLPEGKGVRVLDAVTGRPLWSYLRDDIERDDDLGGLVATADGRMTVLSYTFAGGALVVALDTATGRERWRRQIDLKGATGPARLVDGGDVLLADSTYLGGELVALNRADGTPRWRWNTEELEESCAKFGTAVAVAGSVAALAADCQEGSEAGTVIALSTADGRPRWTWRPSAVVGTASLGLHLPIRSAGDRFWVMYSRASSDGTSATPFAVLLDAGAGTMTAGHPVPSDAAEYYRFPLLSDGVIVYPGEPVVGVDLATGRVRWTRRMGELAGWEAVDGVSRDGVAYVLSSPEEDAAVERASSALMLVALDIRTGEVRARLPYDPARCSTSCYHDDLAHLLAGPGLLMVASMERGGARVRALG